MANGELLVGVRVLIVEDDFFLAMDEQDALEDEGACVVGPYADEAAALSAAAGEMDCAVLDLNLGAGPSFKVAAALRARDIPFLFVTGYDAAVIPLEFGDVERLEKPVIMRNLVQAVASIHAKEYRNGS